MNKKSNINIRLDNELLEQIDKIQVEYFFASRSETIRFLAVCGIKNIDLANKLLKEQNNNHINTNMKG